MRRLCARFAYGLSLVNHSGHISKKSITFDNDGHESLQIHQSAIHRLSARSLYPNAN